jgi:preprotein translocase subunit YajC
MFTDSDRKTGYILPSGICAVIYLLSGEVYALAPAPKNAGGAQPGGMESMFTSLLPLVFIFVIFYFLLIRPQSKKAKEHRKMLENLKRGDKVVTTGGIEGVIEEVDGDRMVLKIGIKEDIRIRINRSYIADIRTGE